MKGYWALGPPEPRCIPFVKKYNITKYINIGSILLDVNQFKKNNFWDIYIKNRNLKLKGQPDQTLFNILVEDDKKDLDLVLKSKKEYKLIYIKEMFFL